MKVRPSDPDILFGMGRSLMKIGGYQHAISYFQRCLKERPDYAPAWQLLGSSYKVLHRHEEAIEAYENAMELDPGSTKYQKNIADVYLVMGNKALYKEGRYQEAIQYYDRTLKIIPRHLNAWFAKGIAYRKLGAYRNATACFLRVVEIDPQNAHAYYEMGQLLEKGENMEEAVRCYLEAIRSDPSHTDAMYKLGNILTTIGDFRSAIEYFDRIIEKKPDSSVAWYAKGVALRKNGQDQDAERCFQRAGKLAASQ
jgi:tetratricopeptide (TPR) repeat protein